MKLDADFKEHVLKFLVRDRHFLKECSQWLDPEDFKQRKGEGPEIHWVATEAINFYHKYREPIGGLLRSYCVDKARKTNLGEKPRRKLLELADDISKGENLVAVEAVTEKLLEYKRQEAMKDSVEEILRLQEVGELDQEKFFNICRKGSETFGRMGYATVDYFESLKAREIRRRLSGRKFPYLMIKPVDEHIRAIGRKHLGVVLAPYKKGKSIFLRHLALAYAQQTLNVIFITLEDPLEQVEDGLDAMLTALPIKNLQDMPKKLRKRFNRFLKMWKGRIKIIDGTETKMTIPRIEEIWENERNRGFLADVVIIDYDDEIAPSKKYQGESSRRQEFADIYREMRGFASRKDIILWTGAQAKRVGETKEKITGEDTAEDISKIRKVSLAIGLGYSKMTKDDNSLYLYIAAHRYDRSKCGWHIVGDRSRGILYDPEETDRRQKIYDKEKKRAQRV